jgi:hypothetical protein
MRKPLVCLFLALGLTSCGNGGILEPTQIAAVRVYNGSPDSPPLSILLRGSAIAGSLQYGFGRFYSYFNAGSAPIQVQNAAGDILLDYPATIAGGVSYTFAVTGYVASLKPVFLTDDTTAAASGNFKIRMVHLAPLGPALDLYITGPTDDITTATPAVTGLTFTNASAYVSSTAGSVRFRITATGDKTVLREVGTFTLNSGQGVTLLFIGNAGAGGGGAPYSSQLVADHNGTT